MAIDDNVVIDRTAAQLINAIDITDGASATGENATALGNQSKATSSSSIAIGVLAETKDTGDIAIGGSSKAEKGGQAVGSGAEASGNMALAIGQFAKATGQNSIAQGNLANATAKNAIQIGEGTNSEQGTLQVWGHKLLESNGHIPIDRINSASDTFSLSLGNNAQAQGSGVSVGYAALANGENAVSIGIQAISQANNAIQIGKGTNSTANTAKISNTTILDATGKIPFSALQGDEVVGLAVNSNNHLIVTYASGSTADLGKIGGGGTTDYTQLENKPSVNGETLIGSKTSADLKLLTVELLPEEFLQYEGGYLEDMFDDVSLPNGIFTCPANEMFTFYTDKGMLDEIHAVTDKSIFFFDKETLNACLIGGDYPFYVGGNSGGTFVTTFDLINRTDDAPTAESTNFVTSAGVKTYVDTAVGDIYTALQGLISGGGVV